MSAVTFASGRGGASRVNVKGTPEAVLSRTTLTRDQRAEARAAVDRLARQGLRVLAVAARDLPPGAGVPARREDAETGLRLVGLVGLDDPPRRGWPRRCAAATAPGCACTS